MRLHRATRAFTLLEIMVVAAIISVILAIAIPNFIAARERAITQTCLANIAGIKTAKVMWPLDTLDTDAPPDSEPTPEDLAPYLSGGFPKGPTGECVYIIGDMRTAVRCPAHGSL